MSPLNDLESFIAKQETLRLIDSAFPAIDADFEIPESPTSRRDENTWGKNVWLAHSDYAFSNDAEVKPFFVEMSQSEFQNGARNFYVEVIASQSNEIQQWFELGFGLQHVSGILRDLKEYVIPGGALLRNPEERDLFRIAELERELTIHQQGAPVFSQLQPDSVDEIVNEWREDLHNPELIKFVAEVDGEVVGLAYGCSTEMSRLHSGLLRPDNSATFAFCSVLPDWRGKGIGKALATRVISELKRAGFTSVVTDWRATNQLSSNTWPKLGFVPTMYRLCRSI